jgi:hypothetical protein
VTRHGEDEVGAGSSGELGLGAEQTAEGDEHQNGGWTGCRA